MSCKKCRHWFVNPNIVIPGEPTEGKCLVSEIKTQSNQVCNAWELSRIAELEAEIERFTAHSDIERQDDKWIPVSERLPEAYEKVIALAKDCMNVDWVLPKELREVGKGAFARLYNVTHWMPLPEPPIVYGKVCEE